MCEVAERIAGSLFELEAILPDKFEVFQIDVSQACWIEIVKNLGDLIVSGKYVQPFELFGKILNIDHGMKEPFALRTRLKVPVNRKTISLPTVGGVKQTTGVKKCLRKSKRS